MSPLVYVMKVLLSGDMYVHIGVVIIPCMGAQFMYLFPLIGNSLF